MERCKYKVVYPGKSSFKTAKFSDRDDAMDFARGRDFAEVGLTIGAGKGLIGQFVNGKATAEFAHLGAEQRFSRTDLIRCLKTIRFNLTSAGYEPNSIMIEGIDAVLSKAEAT